MSEFVLDVRNLSALYGKQRILDDISLQLVAGEWFCLLGPNAAGKTTLLHCIAGRAEPSSGAVLLCGRSMQAQPLDAKRCLGFACAPEQLPGLLTGWQCIEVHACAKDLPGIDAGTKDLAASLRLTRHLDRFVDTYSLGTRQKLGILLALLGQPRLIVLDEAFNGLDPASAIIVKRHLRQRLAAGASVLLATHSLDIVEHYADRAALLIDGRIVRQWDETEIAAMRQDGVNAFEEAIVAASA